MEEENSFGITKVIDCKLTEDGHQLYKVKWQPTWEAAENLASCQHLIDEFWSFVNIAKAKEEIAQQHIKRMHLRQGMSNAMNIDQNFSRLSDDSKLEVQGLIARTNATSAGSPMLKSPSNMFKASPKYNEDNVMDIDQKPTYANSTAMQMSSPGQISVNSSGQNTKSGVFGNKGNAAKVENLNIDKIVRETAPNSKVSNQSSLKYLESFSNPYVKVIVVCKICNKEASKFSRNWKPHYLTHVSSEEKPHQCPSCGVGFVSSTALRKHEEKKHPNNYKPEYYVKEETY